MEYQYHELSYMKTSFEHTQVKEDIENLLWNGTLLIKSLRVKLGNRMSYMRSP